jgi:hypothetical protein
MTYNIGAVKEADYSMESILAVIEKVKPDVLAIQVYHLNRRNPRSPSRWTIS